MPNEDNTQQPTNSISQQIAQLIAAVRSLEDRVISMEPRLTGMEEIIIARLNDTRPLEQQILARLNELVTLYTAMREELTASREELTATREEMTALRVDHERFREETADNFRKIIERQDILNNDNLDIRLEHRQLSRRISRLEEARA